MDSVRMFYYTLHGAIIYALYSDTYALSVSWYIVRYCLFCVDVVWCYLSGWCMYWRPVQTGAHYMKSKGLNTSRATLVHTMDKHELFSCLTHWINTDESDNIILWITLSAGLHSNLQANILKRSIVKHQRLHGKEAFV